MKLTQKQREALERLERYSNLMPWWLAWELDTTGATMAALRRRGYVASDSDELLAKPGPAFYRITDEGIAALLAQHAGGDAIKEGIYAPDLS